MMDVGRSSTGYSSFSVVRKQPVAQKNLAKRRKHIRQVVSLIIVAVSIAMLFVWMRIQMIQLGYGVSQLRKEVHELSEQKNKLQAKVAELKSPERLEKIAKKHYYMRLPLGDEIVYVKTNVEKKGKIN